MANRMNDIEGLKMAVEIEKRGENFYRLAAEKFAGEEKIQAIFKMLGEEEKEHIAIFSEYYEKVAATKEAHEVEYLYDEEVSRYITLLAEQHVFPPEKDAPAVLEEIKKPTDALKMSMQAEKDSILLYGELFENAKFESTKKVFSDLRDEERRHTVVLAKKIQAIING